MEIKTIKISEIVPYENNAKEHPREQIEQIKNSILKFGNNDPIAIDENNVIIEGHGRLTALQELGKDTAECIIISGLTDEEKNAYRIVHNQLTMNSGWDEETLKAELAKISFDMKELGISEEMMDEVESEMNPVENDDFDLDGTIESIEEPTVKRGETWKLGRHRIMCGDSTIKDDVMYLMQGNKADLFLTDPPYNVNYGVKGKLFKELDLKDKYGNTDKPILNDNMDDASFQQFLFNAFTNAYDSMKEGASFYIWHSDIEGYNFRLACRLAKLQIRECLIWKKNCIVLGRQDYQWIHEPCLYGWKDGASHNWYSDRKQTTVLEYDKPLKSELHPTMKPLDLIGYLIGNSSKKDDLILDLFGGSGSTLIAAEQLNRTCYLMELDEKYCDVIIKRWEDFTGEKAERC